MTRRLNMALRFSLGRFHPCPFASLIAFALLSASLEGGHAGESTAQPSPTTVKLPARERPAYCGVQGLYRAMHALGRHVSFVDLVKPEYISSRSGSSLEDLARAARDFGVHAEARAGMTCAMLSHLDCPILLHVKSALGREQYLHWVLFMGVEDGQARIYDGSKDAELTDFEELAARWDGIGLLISTAPINHGTLALSQFANYAMYLGLGVLLIGAASRLHRRMDATPISTWRGGFARCAKEACLLLVLTLLAGLLGRVLLTGAVPSYPAAVTAIQDAHLEDFLPKVRSEYVAKMIADPTVTFVDSRYPTSSAPEGLPHAITLRPDLSEEQCLEGMAGIPKSNRVVVYWQTRVGKKECSNSVTIARKLLAVGYENILLYEEGLDGWREFQRSRGN